MEGASGWKVRGRGEEVSESSHTHTDAHGPVLPKVRNKKREKKSHVLKNLTEHSKAGAFATDAGFLGKVFTDRRGIRVKTVQGMRIV